MLAPLPDLAPTLAALVLAATAPIAPLEVETDPALAFLASQTSAKGRRAQASALGLVAAVFGSTLDALPWHALRYPHVAALRAHLAERLAPATVNRYLAAVRGVLRETARLDLLTAEDCVSTRACSCPGVKGSREPRGRGLDGTELAALLRACDRTIPSGARDAALLAIAYGAGLRRSELVALVLPSVDLTTGAIRFVGKGNRERITYAPAWAVLLVRAWLDVRGPDAGPLFCRIDKADHGESPERAAEPRVPRPRGTPPPSRRRRAFSPARGHCRSRQLENPDSAPSRVDPAWFGGRVRAPSPRHFDRFPSRTM